VNCICRASFPLAEFIEVWDVLRCQVVPMQQCVAKSKHALVNKRPAGVEMSIRQIETFLGQIQLFL
jgi:hypothetical protein